MISTVIRSSNKYVTTTLFQQNQQGEITFLLNAFHLAVSQTFLIEFPFLLMLIVHLFTPKYNQTLNRRKKRKKNLCTPHIHRQCKGKLENSEKIYSNFYQ